MWAIIIIIIVDLKIYFAGPLGNCFDYVDSKDYYEACIYDLCHTDPGSDIICPALQEYAQQCREANGLVGLWRAARPQCGESWVHGREERNWYGWIFNTQRSFGFFGMWVIP